MDLSSLKPTSPHTETSPSPHTLYSRLLHILTTTNLTISPGAKFIIYLESKTRTLLSQAKIPNAVLISYFRAFDQLFFHGALGSKCEVELWERFTVDEDDSPGFVVRRSDHDASAQKIMGFAKGSKVEYRICIRYPVVTGKELERRHPSRLYTEVLLRKMLLVYFMMNNCCCGGCEGACFVGGGGEGKEAPEEREGKGKKNGEGEESWFVKSLRVAEEFMNKIFGRDWDLDVKSAKIWEMKKTGNGRKLEM